MWTIYQKQIKTKKFNERNKATFLYYMAYGDFKNLARRTVSEKVLHDKASILLVIHSMMNIQVGLLQFFDKNLNEVE